MRIGSRRAFHFHETMRLLVLLVSMVSAVSAAVPLGLTAAVEKFRGDAPKFWSFTQATSAEGKSTLERCDAAKPEFDRWTLLQKDGRAPTAEETQDYNEIRSRRSRGGTAPKLTDQFDLTTAEIVSDIPERARPSPSWRRSSPTPCPPPIDPACRRRSPRMCAAPRLFSSRSMPA
jgi:hypothetical protein